MVTFDSDDGILSEHDGDGATLMAVGLKFKQPDELRDLARMLYGVADTWEQCGVIVEETT